jgi:hypothetical protein
LVVLFFQITKCVYHNVDPTREGASCRPKVSLLPPSGPPIASLLPKSGFGRKTI